MKYDVQLKFTTNDSIILVGVFVAHTKENLSTYRVTCDELAEWLLTRERKTSLFVKYGDHLSGCSKRTTETLKCNCGFDQEIKELEKGTG